MLSNQTIRVPDDVKYIIDTLNSKGYKAYAVGGCTRDSIIGKEPYDWDIATSALPVTVKELFPKNFDTGIKHGTITVVINSQHYEVTTFRIDGKYEDNRRPETVEFTSSIEEDLSRRDFTINAIAYSPSEGFIDPFGGVSDIESGIIKTVGNPDERFGEDALRMLRAIRFSAQLGFTIEDKTLKSIEKNSRLIQKISCERIREELNKTLVSSRPDRIKVLSDTGLLKLIIPELDQCFKTSQNHPYHIYNVGDHIIKAVSSIESDSVLRWAMLLHDVGKPESKTTDAKGIDHFYGHPAKSVRIARSTLFNLRFDSKSISRILRLVEFHDVKIAPVPKSVRKTIYSVGEENFLDLLKIQEADIKAQNPEYLEERLEIQSRIMYIYDNIKFEGHCLDLKHLKIDGNELLNMGFNPGKKIGNILHSLLEAVIEKPELNTKESLTELVKEHFRKT